MRLGADPHTLLILSFVACGGRGVREDPVRMVEFGGVAESVLPVYEPVSLACFFAWLWCVIRVLSFLSSASSYIGCVRKRPEFDQVAPSEKFRCDAGPIYPLSGIRCRLLRREEGSNVLATLTQLSALPDWAEEDHHPK